MNESTTAVRSELTGEIGTRKFYMSREEMYSRLEEYIKSVRPCAVKEEGETRDEFVISNMNALSKDITFWTENSLKHNMSDDEFILLTLAKCVIPNCDCISFSYALLNSDFSEDAILAAMYITSKAFSFEGWESGNGDFFTDIIDKGIKYNSYDDVVTFNSTPELNHRDSICAYLEELVRNADQRFIDRKKKLKQKIKTETVKLGNMKKDLDSLINDPVSVPEEKAKIAKTQEELNGFLSDARAKRRADIKLEETKIKSAEFRIEKMKVRFKEMRPEIFIRDRLDWRAIKERQAVMNNPEFFNRHGLLIKTIDEAVQQARKSELKDRAIAIN